ncbi:MAG: helix-turn-helix domain-containing protein [Candidatus Peregrinibacteria bacterium]|nr:helix-turn-helix domain-containing protein [Candidatus Peregrinibacteria bacterium]
MSTIVENKDVIDRKAASRLLKVSMRTLDRYRHAGQLTTKIIDNKILLSRSEIIEFMASQRSRITSHARHEKYQDMSRDTGVDSGNKKEEKSDRNENDDEPIFVETRTSTQGQSKKEKNSENIAEPRARDYELIETYKKMYEQLAAELKMRQEELEGAHYRIGQLEGQIKYSVPLPEHKNEMQRLLTSGKQLEEEVAEKLLRLKKIREALYYEKLNKRIYLAIVVTLLLLQPLWLLLK